VLHCVTQLGAKPIEVVVMNSLTVNVHLALVSFYRPTLQRYKILILKNEFSSDKYVVESQVRCHGYTPSDAIVCIEPQEGQLIWRKEDVLQAIENHGDSTALIWLSGVHYSTGHLFDIKSITEAGHRKGCNVGFDLAHATGNVQLKLHEWEVDVAAWCTYKYLNSGPGALAGYFIHEKYAYSFDMPRFSGWWSTDRDSRLDMDSNDSTTPLYHHQYIPH
jgi:kynureninase